MILLLAACVRHDVYEDRLAELRCEASVWYVDQDNDGFGAEAVEACEAPDGAVDQPGDCDDTDPQVNPGADELCATPGLDDDCDGQVEEGTATDRATWYEDADSDGWGSGESLTGCEPPADSTPEDGDCDETDPQVNPGATETWYDGVDQDCAGDDDFDADGDGHDYGDTDCDDTNPDVNPDVAETWYDGIDSDCNGDDDWDADGDGYAHEDTDCDDTNPDVNPDAEEICGDGVDNDCDGGWSGCGLPALADAGDAPVSGSAGSECGTWVGVADLNGDGSPEIVVGDTSITYTNYTVGGFHILTPSLQATGRLSGEVFGESAGNTASTSADIDGDGAPDLMVGVAGWAKWGGTPRGRVYFEYGSLSGSNSLYYPDASYRGRSDNDELGHAVLGIPDVDADGVDDFIITAPGRDRGASNSGSVYLFTNLPTDEDEPNDDYVLEIKGESSNDALGSAIAASDHDGDGLVDLLLVASEPNSNSGGVLYLVDNLSLTEDTESVIDVASARWKASTEGAGLGVLGQDMDGDGYGDFLIADPADAGSVSILLGPLTSVDPADAGLTITGRSTTSDGCGAAMATGDVDGDGHMDLSIACSGYENGDVDAIVATWNQLDLQAGTVDVSTANSVIEDRSAESLGAALTLGDVDADGFDDLVLGAPRGGMVYLFHGGAGL